MAAPLPQWRRIILRVLWLTHSLSSFLEESNACCKLSTMGGFICVQKTKNTDDSCREWLCMPSSSFHTAQMQWEHSLVLTAGLESQVSHCPCLSLCPTGVCFQAVFSAFASQLLRR